MANVLLLTCGQVAAFAGCEAKDVRKRTKSVPGQVPLYALTFQGVKGELFDAANVVEVYPEAAAEIIAALTPAAVEELSK